LNGKTCADRHTEKQAKLDKVSRKTPIVAQVSFGK
jgi:hypothetical protein